MNNMIKINNQKYKNIKNIIYKMGKSFLYKINKYLNIKKLIIIKNIVKKWVIIFI